MVFEEVFYATLAPLFGGRLYPDVADTRENTAYPYATYTVIGGMPVNSLCGPSGPTGPRNIMIQLNLWTRTRKEANSLALQAEGMMAAAPLRGTPRANPASLREEMLDIYGSRQDFSFWHN